MAYIIRHGVVNYWFSFALFSIRFILLLVLLFIIQWKGVSCHFSLWLINIWRKWIMNAKLKHEFLNICTIFADNKDLKIFENYLIVWGRRHNRFQGIFHSNIILEHVQCRPLRGGGGGVKKSRRLATGENVCQK